MVDFLAISMNRVTINKNVIKPLAKSVLTPLGFTTAASAADGRMYKKILGSVSVL